MKIELTINGVRRTADVEPRKTLVDAYLWIKLPGESDGRCFRWTNGPRDPVYGIKDPTAGAWLITTCERTGTGSSMTSQRSDAAQAKMARPRVSLRSKPART